MPADMIENIMKEKKQSLLKQYKILKNLRESNDKELNKNLYFLY